MKAKRNIGKELLEGVKAIKRGEGKVVTPYPEHGNHAEEIVLPWPKGTRTKSIKKSK